jgi:triosephosphate isomerase (TIM)
MRPVIICANWKMNTSPADAGPLARAIADATAVDGVTRVICPPFVALSAVDEALAGTGVAIGVQNVHAETKGAYTGEISAAMVSSVAAWAILGHSERRRDQLESDALIGHKILRCLEVGIHPMLCVGELLAEREGGQAIATVQAQLRGAFEILTNEGHAIPADLVVAYEPVWAIGTGKTASGKDASEMADAIRSTIADHGGKALAAGIPVLYGGSVTSTSIGEFLDEPTIDGALVGGASLKADEMSGIVARAGITAAARQAADAAAPGS